MKSTLKLTLASGLFWLTNAAYAVNISRPSFVSSADSGQLDQAGNEIYTWLIALFLIILALSCVRPGFFFIKGEKDKAVENISDIFMGAIAGVLLSGVVFAVMEML